MHWWAASNSFTRGPFEQRQQARSAGVAAEHADAGVPQSGHAEGHALDLLLRRVVELHGGLHPHAARELAGAAAVPGRGAGTDT